ncbi:hypothetical protein DIPPA_07304 [Diplonema papillatum]|nr:hypothetical protein DIPPA_07304 [Diplonema papillatum]|eukprot:gene2568-3983_t
MTSKRLLDVDVSEPADKKQKRQRQQAGSDAEGEKAAPLTVAVEIHRAARVKSLRSEMARVCKTQGQKVPLLLYERWQARSALLSRARPATDALIPEPDDDAALVNDLHRGGLPDAPAAAQALRKKAQKAKHALQTEPCDPERPAEYDVWVENKTGDRLDVHLGDLRAYHTINKAHYEKAWSLWAKANDTMVGIAGGVPEDPPKQFLQDVAKLLLRYDSLGGHGYQAGLPTEAFDVLRAGLKVECELFASPLNCRFPTFCSAFPDTDGPFGSLGSCFSFFPTSGSFEANPPFVPETMSAMAAHLEALLSAQAGPLSFFVVVPCWPDVRAYKALARSAFLRHSCTIPARAHSFTDGAQHHRRHLHRPSSYDSAIFILQNEPGAKTYPVPASLEADVRAAMAGDCALPPERRNVVYVEAETQ